ncbi:hypothetical protein Fmac_010739 [Flemingia macrophylla]|uniref:Protein kinase domain-containing protein n=1 Tax=Flemingia macrophylla TaxID=520843 RepID=A0ABD1MKH0_9FABA
MELGGPRVIGDYIMGPRIGSGSFAVVWRSRHRISGLEVAVKEIDKRQLSSKVRENLLKEISILSTINHPNIIRLFEAIQTNDRIYLVLEYCAGGDLAAYSHRYGRVSEAVARHFMRQLAAGLQVLQEKNLIHRDLKPQNLLLATTAATPIMKIGDFGFARSLTQGLADTLCGSPYYMAPEIIDNQKYDAKADLWSVGAILYQLVIGRPPFDGNSQLQLFQNILASTELHFPSEALIELHSDCLDLCRNLLRRNPDERLNFKAFFNHNFLQEPRPTMTVEQLQFHQSERVTARQLGGSASEKLSQSRSNCHVESFVDDPVVGSSAVNETMLLQRRDGKITAGTGVKVSTPTGASYKLGKAVDAGAHLSNQPQVSHLMESIEKDYVLVDSHFASLEAFSDYCEASVQGNSSRRILMFPSKRTNLTIGIAEQTKDLSSFSTEGLDNLGSSKHEECMESCEVAALREEQGISSLHPSNRLELLHQYVQILVELSQEKYNTGLFLESLAVELVVLAIWKMALEICSSWLASIAKSEFPGSSSANESISANVVDLPQTTEQKIDFSDPASVSLWARHQFIAAVDRAEKLSCLNQNMDGASEMPDAMEIIFQNALGIGTSGCVDEYMENRDRAAASYSKAMLLLSFIVGEAENLPLNPPFSLIAANKERILQYIHRLQCRKKSSSESSSKHTLLSK